MIMMMGTVIMIIRPQKLRHWLLKRIWVDVCLTKILAPTLLYSGGRGRKKKGRGFSGSVHKDSAHQSTWNNGPCFGLERLRVKRSFSGQLQGFIELWPAIWVMGVLRRVQSLAFHQLFRKHPRDPCVVLAGRSVPVVIVLPGQKLTAFQFLRRLTIHGECNSLIQTIARPGSQRATGQNFCWFETLRKQKAPEQYWPRHCLTQLCHGAGGRPRSRSNPSVVSNCVNIKIVSHYPSIVVSTRPRSLTMFTWGHRMSAPSISRTMDCWLVTPGPDGQCVCFRFLWPHGWPLPPPSPLSLPLYYPLPPVEWPLTKTIRCSLPNIQQVTAKTNIRNLPEILSTLNFANHLPRGECNNMDFAGGAALVFAA